MKLTAAYILRLLKSPALYIGVAGCALIALWGIISEGNFTSRERSCNISDLRELPSFSAI